MLETILAIASGISTVAGAGKSVVELIGLVKKEFRKQGDAALASGQDRPAGETTPLQMTQFHPQMPNPFGQGNQWLPNLQALAAQNGDAWVPGETQPILGINLTGIWLPPGNPYDQTFIRQYGPYVNFIAGVGGIPTGFGEGLFDPVRGTIHIVGRNIQGAPLEARGQLSPNWLLQGMMATVGPFGQPVQMPFMMARAA